MAEAREWIWVGNFADLVALLPGLAASILKGSVFNTPVAGATNIFAADLTPTNSPRTFRIYAVFNAAGILSVQRTRANPAPPPPTITVAEQLNSGVALTANASYMFDIKVRTGDSLNLQYSVPATILSLMVTEEV